MAPNGDVTTTKTTETTDPTTGAVTKVIEAAGPTGDTSTVTEIDYNGDGVADTVIEHPTEEEDCGCSYETYHYDPIWSPDNMIWTDGRSWPGGAIPTEGSRMIIPEDAVVVYDVGISPKFETFEV